ncbi:MULTISPECIES: lysine--tRNA ligase [Auritidibacter]|uniref:Lysine--tRNA ligase n=2 Tax=Auritidibacter ignavus TaxID=678932 RepID=A0AAJ6DC28_9MICC|nr:MULTISPECIES: lysine--tRNA ligase [Auritidibacter]PXA81730.1 lysine--tRNA ligase [Auritidibacter sp. NML120779]AXR74348.1 lysine--tRNA ligase [Auritidibacter sp. NML130574]NIH72603.1 lysyl-tRNA synthetase class 2 [Auritidibacter ignavus]PXA79155.1 lysine--tRNA ligase [Auritidibacter sp. NML120636]RMX21486.1 lysine--tRNA ligase [Auritidibacter ignavus]
MSTPSDTRDQRQVRRNKRAELLQAGVPAYPHQVPRTHTLEYIRDHYSDLEAGAETGQIVSVAGRVVFQRNSGKLCFAALQEGGSDGSGVRLQVMLSQARVGAEALADYKHLVDLGDHLAVTGEIISSRRGELSIMVDTWQMASKALNPLPVLFADLNEETRVRQRYADLIVRPEAREMVHKRAAITRAVRRTLEDADYTEIETPILQLVHGGAQARPFETHLNAFDQNMTLRIATELYLKRAVVGGIDRVFEIGKVFRNEGVDSTHSPEFTTVEAYEAYSDMYGMAERIKTIILRAVDAVGLGHHIETPRGTADLSGDWNWIEVYPGLSEAVGQQITPDTDVATLREIAEKHQVSIDEKWDAEKLVIELFGEIVEPTLINPTFVYHYPPSAQPLASPHPEEPRVIEAWDLIIGGTEIGTAFSELIDPVIQRERLTAQSLAAAAGDEEAMQLDEDFLRALEYGAPPMGGLGMGIDRLVMLLTGAGIRETILFPLLKPEA